LEHVKGFTAAEQVAYYPETTVEQRVHTPA